MTQRSLGRRKQIHWRFTQKARTIQRKPWAKIACVRSLLGRTPSPLSPATPTHIAHRIENAPAATQPQDGPTRNFHEKYRKNTPPPRIYPEKYRETTPKIPKMTVFGIFFGVFGVFSWGSNISAFFVEIPGRAIWGLCSRRGHSQSHKLCCELFDLLKHSSGLRTGRPRYMSWYISSAWLGVVLPTFGANTMGYF